MQSIPLHPQSTRVLELGRLLQRDQCGLSPLEGLDLRRKVLIGNAAMPTQRQLSRQIVPAGGGYLWVAKDNQPTLRADIEHLLTGQ